MTEAIAMPKRPYKLAKQAMDSALPLRLAEEMLKYTLMPHSSARNHWKAEIAAHLSRLMFQVCSRSNLVDGKRQIDDMHFSAAEVAAHLDDLTMDATEVLKGYRNEKFLIPDNFADGNLFDYGWSLSERKGSGGFVWALSFNGEQICKADGN